MTDSTLNKFVAAGTAADRIAFTPSPPTPASGAAQGYFWHETDTGDTYSWKAGTGWIQVNTASGAAGQSTSLSQISSSLSGAISSTTSLSTAVSTVISGSISTVTSSVTSLSTVDTNQSTSISANLSKINSLSTAVGSGAGYEGGPITAATTADLATWVNQGTATVTDGTGALILKPQVDGQVHAREKTIAGSFTYYVKLDFDFLSTAAVTAAISGVAGIFLRDSSDSEILMLGLYYERISGDEQSLWGAIIQRWTNATSFSATPVLKYNNKPWKWLKLVSDGTTLTFSVGTDGKNFIQVGTETIATFIDTVDRIGIGGIASSNMTEAAITVPYFSTAAPA